MPLRVESGKEEHVCVCVLNGAGRDDDLPENGKEEYV